MIEALILWGVLSGNADRWEMYKAEKSEEEDARDKILLTLFLITIVTWPINMAIHIVRLAFFLRGIPKTWLVGLVAIVPLAVGGVLLQNQNYGIYALIGVGACLFEMMRVAIRAVQL
jgi:hypothetical protein